MSIEITSPDFSAEILTVKQPLSDAFNEAQAGSTKMGVHNGLALIYSDLQYPIGNYLTNEITLQAGKAMVAGVNTGFLAWNDDVIVAIKLDADLIIDIDAEGILINDNTVYNVVLQVTHTPSEVDNNFSGLVSVQGSNQVKLILEDASLNEGNATARGLLLGRLSRGRKYIESIGDNVLGENNEEFVNGDVKFPTALSQERALTIGVLKQAVNTRYSNLRKHVHIEGKQNDTGINSSVMPLSDITVAPATNIIELSGWTVPINWLTAPRSSVYGSTGIWKDVEKFDLFNCVFDEDVQMAFHRTAGHEKPAEWLPASISDMTDETKVFALPDFGSKQFIFDGKGTVFNGNLHIDLLLDFTGQPHDHIYRVQFKNLIVKGDLRVRYGQSFLALAGGTIGTITFDNVSVLGEVVASPWPIVEGVNANELLIGSPYTSAYGFTTTEHMLNNTGNILFSGYSVAGPDELTRWRHYPLPADPTPAYTRGIIAPLYLHNTINSGGVGVSMAMNDPWLYEGADGCIIFKHSAISINNLLGDGLQNGPVNFRDVIRVKIHKCFIMERDGAVDSVGYERFGGETGQGQLKFVGDVVMTLRYFQIDGFSNRIHGTLEVDGNLTINDLLANDITAQDIIAQGEITSIGDIQTANEVIASKNITSLLKLIAGTNVEAIAHVIAGGDVHADVNVTSDNNVSANNDVHAGNQVIPVAGVKSDTIEERTASAGTAFKNEIRSLYNPNGVLTTQTARKIMFNVTGTFGLAGTSLKILDSLPLVNYSCLFVSIGIVPTGTPNPAGPWASHIVGSLMTESTFYTSLESKADNSLGDGKEVNNGYKRQVAPTLTDNANVIVYVTPAKALYIKQGTAWDSEPFQMHVELNIIHI